MGDKVKEIKQVCKCEKCGNEAEMLVTCTMEEDHVHEAETPDKTEAGDKQKVQGTATCTNCGNEADMWIDI